jgi:hypothetical protein
MSTTKFRLKRSSVAGKIPTIGQLDLGEVAINTYDGLMFIKKSVNGTESIVEIGEQTGATYEEFYFSADSNQTVFTGADLDSDILGYIPSLVNVYMNGVLLDSANDFVSNDGTTITLNTGANSGDILQVQSFTQGLQVAEYNYTATAAQTTFIGLDNNNRTLRYATGKVEVYLNGVILDPKLDYTATNGTTIVLTIPAAVNDLLQVIALPDFLSTSQSYKDYHYSFVGNGGVSTITGNDSDGNTLDYKVGALKVFNNGVLMSPDTDYSAIDGENVNFTTALDSSDRVEIQAFEQSSQRPSYEDVKVTAGIYIGGTSSDYLIKEYTQKQQFTPVVVGSSSAGTGNYSSQIGFYTRMGNMITFSLQLVWSTHTGTGNLRVSGLPFASMNETGLEYVFPASTNGQLTYTDYDTLLTRLEKNSSTLLVQTEDGAGNYANVGMADNGSGRILVTGTYFID